MSETPAKPDYRDTVFLPETAFPMKAGLAAKEPGILARWETEDLYGQLRRARAGRERFILHDGPPYANGDIHMGHAMNKVLKDIIVRAQSLTGKDAPYIPGWDCHGLPIEWKVEEAYRAKKLDKDQVDPVAFRAECRAYAEHWVGVQREQFKRLGVMGDWDDPYLTMKFESEARIVAELLKFAESGQLYRGAKPVMWSPVEKTALAEAEVEYEDIVSTQIDVAFEIVEAPNAPGLVGRRVVVWTTTPWTIPVNQALAFNPDANYVVLNCVNVLGGNIDLLVATDLVPALCARAGLPLPFELGGEAPETRFAHLSEGDPSVVIDPPFVIAPIAEEHLTKDGLSFKGTAFAGAVARHPMHHLGGFYARPRPFLPGDFVTTDAGTGLVHMAPDHGEDDFLLCKAHGIDPVFAVEDDGKYRADWAWLGGQGSVINKKFNAPDGPICSDLRDAGALLAASEDFQHSYPHSWRSKAKIIFRCTPQWFIPMDRSANSERPGDVRSAEIGELSEPSHKSPSPEGEGLSNSPTLRQIALDAIARTRWVPERAENRITAMVEGRPDWVISRQRAWGVPIAVYVNRDGDYLRDTAVNARIVAAFEAGGADAWFTADHAALLGPGHSLNDWTPVTDILDVWFDSGSTHAFVIEERYGPDVRADLYIEGSDQHRGWFQSSLLESCGTRGRAPYAAVLTHGFALDDKGKKMSKSLKNVVDPLKIIDESGADILRLWVASTDYFEDVRIGKEILSGASDAYRKLRNTFRYLLGALHDFDEGEKLAVSAMPELERYMLHRLAELDAELKRHVADFAFNPYMRALTAFAQDDLSAFFFDIRKDSLYCDAPESEKRRACRTVFDILFHALVRYAAPVLCFTAEEVWATRYPDRGSVHLLEWPNVDESWIDSALAQRWAAIRSLREEVTEAIEPLRREKIVRSSLEAEVTIPDAPAGVSMDELAEIFIVSDVATGGALAVARTENAKCGRCWRLLPEVVEDGALCARCTDVVG